MTEKRFNLVDLLETLAIADGDECKYYQNCNDDFMSLCKELNTLHEENQQLKKENNNRRASLVDELRGLFQMYLTQCRSISEEAIITLIRNDVKKIVFEVFDE